MTLFEQAIKRANDPALPLDSRIAALCDAVFAHGRGYDLPGSFLLHTVAIDRAKASIFADIRRLEAKP